MTLSMMDVNMEDISLQADSPSRMQLPQRSGSVKSNRSQKSTPDSQMIVSVDKTPTYLTPSQRLQLRKLRINQSITKLKHGNENTNGKWHKYDIYIDNEDEELDESTDVFNVPVSQSLCSLQHKEKFTVANQPRNYSLGTETTRCSSIMSHQSVSDFTSFDTSFKEAAELPLSKMSSVVDFKGVGLSTDALELTLLFNKDDNIQMTEVSQQHRSLLNLFLSLSESITIHEAPKALPPLPPQTKQAAQRPTGSRRAVSSPAAIAIYTPTTTKTSKYFSSTRPSWLPPKTSYDKMKHQKESEDIIGQAIAKEGHVQSQRMLRLQKLQAMKELDKAVWNRFDLADLASLNNIASFRGMYWRGIPPWIRPQAWLQRMGGKPSREFCERLFRQAEHMLKPTATKDIHLSKLITRIDHDLLHTFPEVEYFQDVEIKHNLKKTILSLLVYLNEKINEPRIKFSSSFYFTGLNNLTAVLFHVHEDSYLVLSSLCNIFTEDNLMNSLIALRLDLPSADRALLIEYALETFMKSMETRLDEKAPRLKTHFRVVNLSPLEYASNMMLGLFSNHLNFESSLQLVDIWIYEGSQFLVSTAVALICQLSHKLYGSKKEILDVIGEHHRYLLNNTSEHSQHDTYKYLNIGYCHEFFSSIQCNE